MPDLDAIAAEAVESAHARADFIYLDIAGDPLRVTTFGADVRFEGTGDPDLDGHTFKAFGGRLLDVSDVSNSDSGSDTRMINVSGITRMDPGLVADIANKSLWQGRTHRSWYQIYDETGVTPLGALVADYTGYMSKVSLKARPKSDDVPATSTIELSAENYLSFFSQASERNYLNQADYDPADTSAAATIAASNGLRRDTGAHGSGGAPAQGYSGGSSYLNAYAPYGGATETGNVLGARMNFS